MTHCTRYKVEIVAEPGVLHCESIFEKNEVVLVKENTVRDATNALTYVKDGRHAAHRVQSDFRPFSS